LKANTFLKSPSDLFAGYSLDLSNGTFIAEIMNWQEKFVITVQNSESCWQLEKKRKSSSKEPKNGDGP
jgi:hypothetical protein